MFLVLQAYMKGAPVLTDKQFDELKQSLKESVSSLIYARIQII